ncbi:YueI family protein [Cytobacillus sp. FJAT-54145]|uniref:YueI family protein n=1 Tax=Cytobacillus spartinae TaxID=3299023 RepID=A0ABW6KF41_9BACI
MSNHEVDEYLKQGIYGPKEIKPDERRKFLGTLRERVEIALTQAQVRMEGTHKEVVEAIKNNRKAHVYLNGNMSYEYISKYIKLCNQTGVEFSVVTNKDYNSELGLVVAQDYAIDKEEIYLKNSTQPHFQVKENEKKKGLFSAFSNLFK